ncbi:CHASE domain-containing protein [Ancylomarina sp. 16SWW S1-10-2]|uniref:CHASE domain-containing protein n=1 Tax=Ancylomarina sp. 16SWW S1-10-2 TaxID=2499681 RepID=UPI0012ADBF55|nr:CHASE domain-containing protein [Ancylomarina sp. 16SWW S1-10-2]MRT93931.1 PAS domain S-box protein [Ancylomarina sp. 16SWW S1-10-2]
MRIKYDWRIWMVCIIGLATTLAAAYFVKTDFDKISETEFKFECKEISNKIELRLHANARLLQSGVALWAASDTINQNDWQAFVEKSKIKEDLPGILGTGVSLIIPEKNLDKHCIELRSKGFPNYKVWPNQKRDIYTSIVMLEPLNDLNLRALGYDMMTNSVRREAMERARDLDVPALSGKVLLVQESDTGVQAGNLIYVPIYHKNRPTRNIEERRSAILGWVFSPYRMDDLIQGILDDWDFKKSDRALHLNIYDGLECSPQNILFESHSNNQKYNTNIRFASQTIVDFNGHNWTLDFKQKNGNIFTDYLGMWVVLFGGIIIIVLLLLLSVSLIDTKNKAQKIAEKVTAELKESERQLEKSQRISNLGRYSFDIISGNWTSSKTLDEILGIQTNDKHPIELWIKLLHTDNREQIKKYLNQTITKHLFFDKEYKIVRDNDKQVRWVHGLGQLEFDKQKKPFRIIGTIRDITERKLAEIEIQNITNRLQLATNAANIGVWDRDLNDNKIIWDKTMYELFGFSKEQSKDPASAWNEALHPDDILRVNEEIQMALRGEKEYNTEFRVIWPDQSIHQVRGRGLVSYDESGKPIRILGIDMDITEQKKANKMIKRQQEDLEVKVAERTKELIISEKKLKISIKDISDYKFALDESSIVAITDNKGIINYVNDYFCKISKFDKSELIGNSHKIINSGYHSDEFFIHLWRTISQGKVWRGEIKNEAKDGSIYWVDSTIVPFLDEKGKPYQYIAIRFDITSKKIAEESIISAKDAANSANKAKSEFLANMSHEIRTPMNAVIGFSELLAQSIKDGKQLSQVESIRNSGKTLLKIINDILDLSKIEAGKIEIIPEVINLKELISEVKDMFILKAKEKDLYFAVEYKSIVPKMLLIDEVRVRQILFNIIGNALKFTEQGHVIVTVDGHRDPQNHEKLNLTFHVEDTGMGISHDEQDLIFEPFNQQKGQSSKYGGTGLGLSITKKLIEKMGGTITLDSEIGKGSQFSVRIPNITIATDEIKTLKDTFDHSEIVFENAKIMIVDDNEENRKLIRDLLECSQIQFSEACNGKTAVALAKEIIPDIILMDLRMPVMDGYEATQLLRQNESTKSIPVLAISASTRKIMYGDRSNGIFNEYLIKPINASVLFEKIKKYLPFKIRKKLTNEETPKEQMVLTENQINDLPDLIHILETKFIPKHQKISQSQMIDHIEEFGMELKALAEENDIEYLLNYANEICQFADNFEIEKLTQSLKRFPQITEQFKNYN